MKRTNQYSSLDCRKRFPSISSSLAPPPPLRRRRCAAQRAFASNHFKRIVTNAMLCSIWKRRAPTSNAFKHIGRCRDQFEWDEIRERFPASPDKRAKSPDKQQQQITIKARVTITTESKRAASKSKNEKSETQKTRFPRNWFGRGNEDGGRTS